MKRFESIFGQHYQPVNNAEGGELIIFWESGTAPVKTQEDFFFSAVKGAGDGLFFSDNRGLFTQIPFDNRQSFSASGSLTDLRGFRVVLPVYEAATVPRYSHAIVRNGAGSFMFEKAEDIQVLAVQTLKERMLRELSATLTRMAVKKLAESAVRNAGTSKGDSKMDQSESEKKKAKKEKATREALALGLQIFNLATEKADTRNWQSLPNTIYYTRVPLQKGANELNITLQGASAHSFTIQVNGTGNLQIMNITK